MGSWFKARLQRPAVKRWLKIAFAILMFAAAAWAIRRLLAHTSVTDILHALRSTSPPRLLFCAGLVLLSYLSLGVTEAWTLKCLGRPLGRVKPLMVSFAAYALSNSTGFGPAAVSAVRLRLYGPEGLSAKDIAAVTVFAAAVVTLTGAVAAGFGLLLAPVPLWLKPLGLLLLAPLGLLLVRRPHRVLKVEITPPALPGRLAMLGAGMADWLCTGTALFVLLPQARIEALPGFVAVFVVGSVVSSASGVPAGIGVFEAVVLGLRAASGGVHETAAALILYRMVNALGPLLITAVGFGVRQAVSARRGLRGRAVRST